MDAAHLRAFETARESGDVAAMTEAALALAAGRMFGTIPGRLPAFLHEAYRAAAGADRARVAVALARAWAYGGDPARAVAFAEEAAATADSVGDPVLLAGVLDAQLLVHWGPDDLDERLAITRRLEDAVAHLTDVEARMTAYLWRLTTALECLDLPATQRQLRALDALAEETGSPRVRFFAASRRGMYALLTGDPREAARHRDAAVAAGRDADEADTLAIDRTLSAEIARQTGDTAALVREAALHEEFGTREGIVLITAVGAGLWLAAGQEDRAGALLHQLVGSDVGSVPRDVYWLPTVTALAEVAAGVGAQEIVAETVRLLEPYAGRGVVDAGGVLFLGVVDDCLSRSQLALGRTDVAERHRLAAADGYRRMGAAWWRRRLNDTPAAVRRVEVVHLHPGGAGLWVVGPHGATHALPEMKGLRYLRALLDRPGVEVPALDLSDAVAGHAGVQVHEAEPGPLIDRQALGAYRRRLTELDAELEAADAWGDPARGERLADEREALLAQVREATGLAGRLRAPAGARERARVAVRKAISAALDRIDEVDPGLARLLRDTVTTGGVCRYGPDPGRPVRWVLDR